MNIALKRQRPRPVCDICAIIILYTFIVALLLYFRRLLSSVCMRYRTQMTLGGGGRIYRTYIILLYTQSHMRKYTHTRAHTTRAVSFDVVFFAEPTQGTAAAARHPARDLSSDGDHNGNHIIPRYNVHTPYAY